jgi:hypothetical protein
MLGYAAGLALGDNSAPNPVQQGSLAVVYVTQDANYGLAYHKAPAWIE